MAAFEDPGSRQFIDALRAPLAELAARFETHAAELLEAARTLQQLAVGEHEPAGTVAEDSPPWLLEPVRVEVKCSDLSHVAAFGEGLAGLPGVRAVAGAGDPSTYLVTLAGTPEAAPAAARCFRCGRPVAKAGQSALCEACMAAFKEQRRVPRSGAGPAGERRSG